MINPENIKYDLKRKAFNGVFILGVRRIVFQVVISVASIIIARILFPVDYGIFAIIMLFVNLFTPFSDLGFGSAIIQGNRGPSKEDLQNIFAIQIFLGLLMAVLMYILAPVILFFYKNQLNDSALFYLRFSSLAVILYNLKLIPAFLLERAIDYRRIFIVELAEVLVMQCITICFAFWGFGYASFVWGMLISRFFSAVFYYLIKPWPIGFRFSFKSISRYFSFGLSYQLNSILATISSAFGPIIVGVFSGVTGLGLVNWAIGVACIPRVVSDIISRIIFPFFSRIKEDKTLMKLALEDAIYLISLFSFPLITLLIVLAKPITYIIFTDRWAAAIPALILYSIYTAFSILSDIAIQALMAIGKMKIVRNINFFWTTAQWVFGTIMVLKFGFIGMPITWLLVSMTSFVPLIILNKSVNIKIINKLLTALVFSFITGLTAFFLNSAIIVNDILGLLVLAGISLSITLIIIIIFEKDLLKRYLTNFNMTFSYRQAKKSGE